MLEKGQPFMNLPCLNITSLPKNNPIKQKETNKMFSSNQYLNAKENTRYPEFSWTLE